MIPYMAYFILVETIVMIAVILLVCPTLLRKYGKRNMSLVGIILALIGHLIYLINPMDFNWVVASCVIRGIFFAPLCSVILVSLVIVLKFITGQPKWSPSS